MSAKKHFRRHQNKTVFIAVEGLTELAFLDYLKSIYISRKCGVAVTVKNAHGKGPSNVIDKAVRAQGAFDKRVAVFDGDVAFSKEDAASCEAKGIKTVVFSPAVEAVILMVLGVKSAKNTADCKRRLERHFGGSFLEVQTYERYMDRGRLEVARKKIPELNRLILFLQDGDDE